MFIRYFVEIPRPRVEVESELLRSPAEMLAGPAYKADERGERLLGEMGFDAATVRISSPVVLRIGQSVHFPSRTLLPISWSPASLEALIPSLDADIELAELGSEHTQLSISARYKPPLGSLGRALDRLLLHRLAEATVKDLLDRLAEQLSATPTEQAQDRMVVGPSSG